VLILFRNVPEQEALPRDLSEVVWSPYQFGPGAADRGAFTDLREGI
jgi:hypothetical protein